MKMCLNAMTANVGRKPPPMLFLLYMSPLMTGHAIFYTTGLSGNGDLAKSRLVPSLGHFSPLEGYKFKV